MCIKSVARLLCACFLFSYIASPALASSAVETIEQTIEKQNSQVIAAQKELELTKVKRKEAQDQLDQLNTELKDKRDQLEDLRDSYGDSPTEAQLEFVRNEEKRIALAQLSIESRSASVSRLERKEQELQSELKGLSSSLDKNRAKLEQVQIAQKKQREAQARAMAEQMAALKRENERLRKAMEEEARLSQMAIEEAARLAEEARLREQEVKRLAAEKAAQQAAEQEEKVAAEQSTPKAPIKDYIDPNAQGEDLSRVALEGEEPIYEGDDGFEIIMRSRSTKDKKVFFRQVAPDVFQAETQVDPGRAYFDLRKRRYRGHFEGEGSGDFYRFTYRVFDDQKPKLTVKRLEESEDQVVSQGESAF